MRVYLAFVYMVILNVMPLHAMQIKPAESDHFDVEVGSAADISGRATIVEDSLEAHVQKAHEGWCEELGLFGIKLGAITGIGAPIGAGLLAFDVATKPGGQIVAACLIVVPAVLCSIGCVLKACSRRA